MKKPVSKSLLEYNQIRYFKACLHKIWPPRLNTVFFSSLKKYWVLIFFWNRRIWGILPSCPSGWKYTWYIIWVSLESWNLVFVLWILFHCFKSYDQKEWKNLAYFGKWFLTYYISTFFWIYQKTPFLVHRTLATLIFLLERMPGILFATMYKPRQWNVVWAMHGPQWPSM